MFRTLLLICSTLVAAQPAPEEVIRRSVAVNERDWQEGPSFTREDRTIEKKDDEQPVDHTYQIFMMEGSPYRHLVAIDGGPLPPARQRQEDQKQKHELARRRSETRDDREIRIRKYQKDREQDHTLMTQMALAFQFHLVGEDSVDGRPCYVLAADPNPDYKPANREAKVLTGMKGKLWVDEQQFHWVRVEAEVIHPVTFGGFLARVGSGTRFELDQAPVSRDVWQPKLFSVNVVASILFWSHNSTTKDMFSGYHRGTPSIAPAEAVDQR